MFLTALYIVLKYVSTYVISILLFIGMRVANTFTHFTGVVLLCGFVRKENIRDVILMFTLCLHHELTAGKCKKHQDIQRNKLENIHNHFPQRHLKHKHNFKAQGSDPKVSRCCPVSHDPDTGCLWWSWGQDFPLSVICNMRQSLQWRTTSILYFHF